ncbi:MAG: citrate synthase [Armatimonadetes bacterium]|nr:citrate synthase [Armatimonadota bacterium]
MATITEGLRDIIAGTSEICYLDGVEGILAYRGYDIHDLADKATFEEVVYLLWFGQLPNKSELGQFTAKLAAHRPLPPKLIDAMRSFPANAIPMSSLRTVVSALAGYDPLADVHTPEANLEKAYRLTAQLATIVAALDRVRKGLAPVEPDPTLSHAANFLYMLSGEKPDEMESRVFDIALVLHADHEFNASTFACRVIAGTLADMYSAVVGGIGALKGPLHGGANEAVMRMLDEVGDRRKVETYVRGKLERKEKVMGFGHAVYRTEDPRATHLRVMSKELCEKTGHPELYEMSNAIENLMYSEKKINANVDFYSATTYHALGISTDLFTPIFAVSRVSGWTAHILEQYANNKLIRPRSEYIGPALNQPWVPIEER